MVWGLFPVDPQSVDEKYYIYAKGSYKVGRKGCDVTIGNDKGVSRIHAEIVVDAMEAFEPSKNQSTISSKVRIRDCSKYGTFIVRNSSIKEKVHECPDRETYLKDGELVSFGTGNATYRFCFVPLKFCLCSFTNSQVAPSTHDRVSSIGACVTHSWTTECTHAIVDPFMPVTEEIVDAIVAKKPLVLSTWLEFVMASRICSEIPGGTSYVPTLTFDGSSVTVADASTRENCLTGYCFLLESANMYKFQDRMKSLLEVAGAKVRSVEDFDLDSQYKFQDRMKSLLEVAGAKVRSVEDFDLDSQDLDAENNNLVFVVPAAADRFRQRASLSKINEINLISAVISGYLDPSALVPASVVVSSSCSTDETVVADSDEERETAISDHPTIDNALAKRVYGMSEQPTISEHAALTSEATQSTEFMQQINRTIAREEYKLKQASEYVTMGNKSLNHAPSSPGNGYTTNFVEPNRAVLRKKEDDPEIGNVDILYSQHLIVRSTNPQLSTDNATKGAVINFKQFRKTNIQSGNSFTNLVPFSKYPYTDSDYDKEISEYVKEEKKRKQMEAVAEDLFNSEKGRRRGVAGSLQGLLHRG